MSGRPAARVAIVTGAAAPDGIGAACALALAQNEWAVAVLDREPSGGVLAQLIAAGARAVSVRVDLSDEIALMSAVDEVCSELGEPSLLVNNAADLTRAPLARIDGPTLRRVLEVNVVAPLLLTRRLAPAMQAAGWGRIVNIASNTFDRPPAPGLTPYVTSKGAMIGLTRALAVELGPAGVTVNAIAPGLTRTGSASTDQPASLFEAVRDAQAVPRTLVPGDYGGLVAFLASDAAAMITGQTIRADGGLVFG